MEDESIPWLFWVMLVAFLLYGVAMALNPEDFLANARRYARPKQLLEWFPSTEAIRLFTIV
jgi:hypothetical protein